MTPDEGIAEIQKFADLDSGDIADLEAVITQPDKKKALADFDLLRAAYESAGKVNDRGIWPKIVTILQQVPQWIPLANGLLGVLGAVKGLLA